MSDKPQSPVPTPGLSLGDASSEAPSARPAAPSEGAKTTGQDVVLACGVTPDQKGLRVLRARDERVELGEVRPLEEGKPIHGDVVRLKPRPDFPLLCDVETDFSAQSGKTKADDVVPTRRRRAGPPQVATRAYRDNWEAIYRARTAPGSDELN